LQKLNITHSRFISLHILDEIHSVEDAAALGLVADEFLLDSLRDFCVSKLKQLVTVENVWSTLNATVLVPALADACSEVLLF